MVHGSFHMQAVKRIQQSNVMEIFLEISVTKASEKKRYR